MASTTATRLGAVAIAVVIVAGAWTTAQWERVLPILLRLDPEIRASPHVVDPAQAGPDFRVQGEYFVPGARPWGAQVIAGGDGRFEARALPGGLPGYGWMGHAPLLLAGEREGPVTRLRGDGASARIRGRRLLLVTPDGMRHRLRRLERKSNTLGLAPPRGARVLFDGTGAHRFDGDVDERGHLKEGATTLDEFQSFYLHLEFRVPFEPLLSDQKRGNSGVYVQKRYEVQILDGFGRDPSKFGAAAIYGVRAPDLNLSYPPLAWQTYDIDFTAARFDAEGYKIAPARITVRHNGFPVHDDVELLGPTGAGHPEGPEPGPIYLQDHASPVRFRNIWIVPHESKARR